MTSDRTAPQWRSTHARTFARDGFCIIEDILPEAAIAEAKQCLWQAAPASRQRGAPTFIPGLDPNESNVRVFNLLDLDPLFRHLIVHPAALACVQAILGKHFIVSNFTANIALPGARSMVPHSDLSLVMPEPWLHPWSMNIIWCLDDVYADNGATRYLPGSHLLTSKAQLPQDLHADMQAFRAPAGAIVVMDGRLWHTSGNNVTQNAERALLFGYYTASFLRPQVNWNASLSEATQANLTPELSRLLGLGSEANIIPTVMPGRS